MALLFKDIEEFQDSVSVNSSFDLDLIQSKLVFASRKYIIPWLGADQFETLAAAHQAETLSPTQQALLPYVQASLANFALLEYLPTGEVSITSSGVHQATNANYKAAFTGQIGRLQDNLMESGYNELEFMLEFLEENESDYPEWSLDPVYNKNKELFINTSVQFAEAYNVTLGRLMFDRFRAIIADVELFTIEPNIGKDYFAELKALIQDKTPPSAADAKSLNLIRKVCAFLTIKEAVAQNWVRVTQDGVVFKEQLLSTRNEGRKSGSADQLSLKVREADERGLQYLDKLMELLRDNPDNYPTFRDDTTVNPTEEECPIEEECCSVCSCGVCQCNHESGIVVL